MFRFSSLVAVVVLAFGCQGAPPETPEDVPTAQAVGALSQDPNTESGICFWDSTHHQPWPCNGYLINNYSAPVQIWSDYVYGTIAAHSTSDRYHDDVDFVLSPCSGTWLKLGPLNVTVESSGCVTGYWYAADPPKS